MNPSPEAIAAIRAKVTDWTQSNLAILAALSAPSVDNPTTRPNVPRVMSFADLIGMVKAGTISQASYLKVWLHVRFNRFYDDLMNGNNAAVAGLYPEAFEADGTLQPAEAQALATYASEIVPDPSWSALIGWDVATLGRPLDLMDIIAARPE